MSHKKYVSYKSTRIAKFWRSVQKAEEWDDGKGCWIWIGPLDNRGYGRFGYNGHRCLAHRASYALFRGPVRPELFVCHHCDNPPCVNPRHLFVGTPLDNIRDAAAKGRMHRKLDPTLTSEIKRLRGTGITIGKLATHFDLSVRTIYRALNAPDPLRSCEEGR